MALLREDPAPLVSVAITAFNSAATIARAIRSVELQQTTFPVEIVVADDFSPDNTATIVRNLAAASILPIRLLPRTRNIGMQRNYYEAFEACRGRFIAWLDADDIWTDPHKLTLQVHALQSDPSLAACAHPVRHVSLTGKVLIDRFPSMPSGRYTLADLIRRNFIPSPSIVFRTGLHRQLPPSFFSLTGCVDWPILLLAARDGDILLLGRIMADYGISNASAYSSQSFLVRERIDREVRDLMAEILPPGCHRQIRAALGAHYESLAWEYAHDSLYPQSLRAALHACLIPAPLDNLSTKSRTLAAALLRTARSRLPSPRPIR